MNPQDGSKATAGPGAGGGRRFWRKARRRGTLLVGGFVLLAMVFSAIFAPMLAGKDPYAQSLRARLKPPGWEDGAGGVHLLGTDPLGRDVFSRLLYGGRISLLISVAAVLLSGVGGTLLGLISGFFGGRLDQIIMRVADVQLSIPVVLLAIAIVAVLGPDLWNLVLVLAISGWVVYARTVRSSVLSLKEREFIEVARALGGTDWWILYRHVLPNVAAPIIVIASQQVGFMILMEAALSFLGLGVQPPVPSWGGMIAEGRNYLNIAPFVALAPGLALMLMVLAVNFVGDGLRDLLDPEMKL